MRLLNVTTLQLESFSDWSSTPPYLILSHVWGSDEVTFDDITETEEESDIRKIHAQLHDLQPNTCSSSFRPAISKAGIDYSHLPHLKYSVVQKKGWAKIEGCLREAKKYGLKYIWCDTCCIDKSSSAELSEAINSMWDWVGRQTLHSVPGHWPANLTFSIGTPLGVWPTYPTSIPLTTYQSTQSMARETGTSGNGTGCVLKFGNPPTTSSLVTKITATIRTVLRTKTSGKMNLNLRAGLSEAGHYKN